MMFFFVSCEDPIDVDLEEGEKLLIIDGLITDQPLPYQVKLSTTAPYFDKENPPVKDAVLTLTDSEGNTEILTYTDDGVFLIKTIQGKIGNDYTLQIQYEGQNYTAETSIRRAPRLDSLLIKDEVEADREGEDDDDEDIEKVKVEIYSITEDQYYFYEEMSAQIENTGLFSNPPPMSGPISIRTPMAIKRLDILEVPQSVVYKVPRRHTSGLYRWEQKAWEKMANQNGAKA